jgi:predicted transcriptional regulator
MNTNESTKSKARAIIDQLPDSASWDDVMYELYVREAIDAGLADVAAGRTYTTAEVRARLEQRIRRAS